ncbi:hypothetical protein CDO46_00980 [Pigmentiphaga sp. NML030171]|nr:hypothetical protein CDO46_00980 [Pigmentiphaga sp. NML030171]
MTSRRDRSGLRMGSAASRPVSTSSCTPEKGSTVQARSVIGICLVSVSEVSNSWRTSRRTRCTAAWSSSNSRKPWGRLGRDRGKSPNCEKLTDFLLRARAGVMTRHSSSSISGSACRPAIGIIV